MPDNVREVQPLSQAPYTSWEKGIREVMEHFPQTKDSSIFEKKFSGSRLDLEFKNQVPFDQQSFFSFLIELNSRLYQNRLSFNSLEIKASGTDQTILMATVSLSDMASYLKKEISQPELIRRFQVQVLETVFSLKTKIKEVRSQEKEEETRGLLEKWLSLEPRSVLALSLLGNIYRDEKKYEEAIKTYLKIVEVEPHSLFAYHNLGFCHERTGNFDASIDAYKKAMEIEPRTTQLMRQLAEVHRKNGDITMALDLLAQAKAIKETSDLLMIEGNTYRDSKKYEQALTDYEKGYQLNPNDHRFLFNKILINLDTKKWNEARKEYQELQWKDPLLADELSRLSLFQEKK